MIPNYLRQYEAGLKNFSLHFDYFTTWDDGANLKARIEHHTNAAATITRHAAEALTAIHDRQRSVLKPVHDHGGMCIEITARLSTPYVSGLGGCHPTETGFILDRNTGLPYLPASSIKGVLRLAHALNLAEQHPEKIQQDRDGNFIVPDTEESMRKYFGDTDTAAKDAVRGQLVFLDAFPAGVPTIKRDIMNPHFGKYYDGTLPPVETENPIPVMFMAVEKGIDFKFRALALPLADGAAVDNCFDVEDKRAILAMFRRAGEELGFGAKTSVGYGRMANVADSTESMAAEWRRIADEKEDRLYPWRKELRKLDCVSNWGDFRQKGIDNSTLAEHKDKPEVTHRIFELACGLRQQAKANWEAARDSLLREWFAPAGIAWPPEQASGAGNAQPANDAAAELERIKGISKWADYITAPATLDLLGKGGLKLLREKLKGWGCEDKNAKDDKKAELERLKQFMIRKD